MATDSTHLLPGETSVETESDLSMNGSDMGSVQLAAATDAPIPVNIPRGQQIVVIPVRPGQTIELPTDSPDGLLAKLGADGNLAIVVDGRTIILQGYAAANEQEPIRIVTSDGDVVDIVEVLAGTLPDLDIQTAAGPAAAGAQGGAQGAEGSGIFVPFAAGPLLGGFDAAGTLKATELAYKNIDDERVFYPVGIEEETPPNPPTIDFFPEDPEVKNGRAVVSDEGLPGKLPDSDPVPDDETNDAATTGTFVVSDPDVGDTLTVTMLTDGLPALSFGGETVSWILSPDGHTLTGETLGTAAIVIEISTVDGFNYDYKVTLNKPLDHSDPTIEDELSFSVGLKVTDSTGLFDTAQLEIEIEDDSPFLEIRSTEQGSGTLFVELDETVGPDRYSAFDVVDGGNNDDIVGALAQKTTDILGGLKALFFLSGGFGADGPGTFSDSLSFIGIPPAGLPTNLEATSGGAITLFLASDTLIEGKDTDGHVVFTIEILDVGGGIFQLQTTLFEALVHDDNSKFDETVNLLVTEGLVQLQYEATVVDFDGDTATDSEAIDLISEEGSYFTFDDDGPDASLLDKGIATLVLDETRPVGSETDGDSDPAGLDTVTVSFAGNFGAPDFGSDGAGSAVFSLKLTGSDVASGLYALDPTDTDAGDGDGIGQGDEILLNQSGNVITGSVNGTTYFTITLDPNTAEVTFEQQNNIWHSDTGSDDDTETLTLASANLLQLVQTVTDADGDSDTAAINLGQGVFQIEDDGPSASVANGTVAPIVLDESPAAQDEEGDFDPAGRNSVTVDLTGQFGTASFGTDGPGSATYSLSLLADGLPTGMFALEPFDTQDFGGDGDGYGQGDPIVLNQLNATTVAGMVGGTIYFIISVDPISGELTFAQALNIWHSNAFSDDDTETLNLPGADMLQLVQTVTDADGDSEEAAVNLGQGVFQIEDDGPSVTGVTGTNGTPTKVVGSDTFVVVDEDDIAGGNNDSAPGDDAGKAGGIATGTISANLGTDQPGTFSLDPLLNGTLLQDTNGAPVLASDTNNPILLTVVGNLILGQDIGTNAVIFTLTLDPFTGAFTFDLEKALEHPTAGTEDDILLSFGAIITDADGDSETASIRVLVDDDSPTLTIDPSTVGTGGLAVELDETVGADRYAPGEPADGGNTDDAGPGLAQVTTTVPGGLKGLFTVGGSFGADGPGTLTDGLSFIGIPVGGLLTTLQATDGGAITLFAASDTLIEGKDTDNHVVFTIEIVDVGGGIFQLETTLFEALVHPDNDLFDEAVQLLLNDGLVQLEYEVTRTDGDNDSVTDTETIDLISTSSSYFTFDDDGPTLTVTADLEAASALAVELDETEGTDRAAPGETADGNDDDTGPGLGQKTTSIVGGLTALFTVTGDFGSDGPGTDTESLSFIGIPPAGLLTTLEATNGGAITLFAASDTLIEGKDTTDQVVFTIEIVEVNPGEFQLVTTLFEALVHGDNTKFDESVQLLLDDGLVQLEYEVTRKDGDNDPITESATIDLISEETSYFTFDDDGPTAPSLSQNDVQVVHDETPGLQDDDVPGTALTSGGATVASLFAGLAGTGDDPDVVDNPIGYARSGSSLASPAGGDGGSDGIADVSYALKVSNGTFSGVSITGGTDIFLYQVSPTLIVGRVGNEGAPDTANPAGTIAFAIAIDPDTGEVFTVQYLSLLHGNPNDPDDAVSLLDGAVKVTVTITDGDGDEASADENVGDQIVFHDDGPTLTVDPSAQGTSGLLVELDETVGPDRYSALDVVDGGNTDDAPGVLAQKTTTVPGGLKALFTVGGSFGADGPGTLTDSLSFIGIPVGGLLTTLQATDGGAITLFAASDTLIEGKDTDGHVVFTIEIVDLGGGIFQLETTLNEALVHPDNTKFDESVQLLLQSGLVQLEYEVTRTDGDNDSITETGTIDLIATSSSYFIFDDDGPVLTSINFGTDGDAFDGVGVIDEDALPDGIGDSALGDDAGGTLVDGVINFDFGSDGLGSLSIDSLTVTDSDGNPVSLGNLHTSDGRDITINQSGPDVDGLTTWSAVVAAGEDGAGDPVFTFTLDTSGANLGAFTFQLHQALEHPYTDSDFDNDGNPETAYEDNLLFDFAIVATDGDGDEVTGHVQIDIDDDSPVINSIQDAIMPNVEGLSVNGTFDADFGADLCKQVLVDLGSAADGTNYNIASLGTDANGNEVFKVDVTGGDVDFTFYYYATFNAGTEEGEIHAFLEAPTGTGSDDLSFAGKAAFFDLTANCDGTYQFDLLNNGFAQTTTVEFADAPAGNFEQLYIFNGSFFTSLAALPPGQDPDVIIDAIKDGLDDDVNTSNNGLAVDNQNTNVGETLTFDFKQSQPTVSMSVAKFTGSASQVTLVITISAGMLTSTATVVLNDPGGNNGVLLVIDENLSWDSGFFAFTSLEVANIDDGGNANDGAAVNLTDLTFNSETSIGDISLNFDLTVVDGDGDSKTVADGLTVNLVGTDDGSPDFALTGDNGNPEVIASGAGEDTIAGGTGGNDTVDYSNSDAGVTVNLATNTASGGYADGDVISGLENIIGSEFNDDLTGDGAANKLSGLGGNDTLHGGAGNDTLDGGTGTDSLFGDDGDDVLIFRDAADTHDGGSNTSNDLGAGGNTGDVLDIHNVSSLDLTAIDNGQFTGLETIRMTGDGSHTLTLDSSDVISFGTGTLDPGGSNDAQTYDAADAIRIEGGIGDTVNLGGGDWFAATGATGVPAGFDLYVHVTSGANPALNEDAYVLVQQGVTVNGIAP